MDDEDKIAFEPGQILTYNSENNSRQYYISLLDSGVVSYTQTGSTESDCRAIYEFEIIGICPLEDTTCRDVSDMETFYESKQCPECQNCITICKRMSTNPVSSRQKVLCDPLLSYFDIWTDYLSTHDEFERRITLNGQKYKDCYIFNISNGEISELYYCHKFGFVRFRLNNNEIYNLEL